MARRTSPTNRGCVASTWPDAMTLTFGVDLGGTNVRCGVVDEQGTVLDERKTSSRAADASWSEIVDAMIGLIRPFAADHSEAVAVGVGAAGLVTRDGQILYAPNIPGFRNAPVRDALAAEIDLPVFVDND